MIERTRSRDTSSSNVTWPNLSAPSSIERIGLNGNKSLLKRSSSSTSFERGDELSSQRKLSLHRALSLSKKLILVFNFLFLFVWS